MDTTQILIASFVGLIVWLLIMYFFYRYVFSIKRQLWNQKQVLKLLIMIAEKQGVDKTSLADIDDMINRDDEYLK